MPQRSYDAALKELFELERPTILRLLCPGARTLEPVNVEFADVKARRVDLLFLVDGLSLLHVELQGHNEPMGQRLAEYFLLIKSKYPDLPLTQVVLYFGPKKLNIADRWICDGLTFHFQVRDIRDIDARDLLATGNAGDLVLATVAGGGAEALREAVARIGAMETEDQNRLLTQILILAGLRGTMERIKLEVAAMELELSERTNPYLAEIAAKGRREGRVDNLRTLLQAKFGEVPTWTSDKLSSADTAAIDRWTVRVLTADTVEAVFGVN